MTVIMSGEHAGALSQALDILTSGGLVAFPTDTVYGLGALISHESLDTSAAIDQLYLVKERDPIKAIAVLIGRFSDLAGVASEMSPAASRLAGHFWPGALTLVVSRQPGLPKNLSQGATIGVRMPDHPLALELLRLSGPLAVTSANLSGQPSCVTAAEVFDQLGGRIALILDGGITPGGRASTVVDCTGREPIILRPGPISAEEIYSVLKK